VGSPDEDSDNILQLDTNLLDTMQSEDSALRPTCFQSGRQTSRSLKLRRLYNIVEMMEGFI